MNPPLLFYVIELIICEPSQLSYVIERILLSLAILYNMNILSTWSCLAALLVGSCCGVSEQKTAGKISSLKCREYMAERGKECVRYEHIKSRKILGGNIVTDRTKFPHMASISQFGKHMCGGTLISRSHVLTAAHCFTGQRSTLRYKRLPTMQVTLGLTHLRDRPVDKQVFKVTNVTSHPDHDHDKNDIALVELDREADFDDYVRPACLYVLPGDPARSAVTTGWGKTTSADDMIGSPDLMEAPFEFNSATCKDLYLKEIDNKTMVCASGRKRTQNFCKGDSGGPLQIRTNCISTVVGVVSHSMRQGGVLCAGHAVCSQYSDLSSHFIPPFCTSSRKIVMNRWLESVEARLLSAGVIIPFMIGGSKAGEKHFPHLASISWRNTHICGASLISKRHILTAAHCFEDLLKREAWVEKNKSIWVFPGEVLNKYQVKFGVNDLNSTYRVQNLPLRTVYIHPAFTPALLLNDIAVAQLDGEVQFSDVVRPACLSTEAGNNTSRATISGWGVTDTGLKSQSSQHMMHLSVDFADPEDCINKYQLFNKNVTRRHKEKLICTKSLRDNHNACKGDSGGPLQTRSGCVFTVHGMVSHGAPEFSGSKHRNITAFCEGSHVIFTRVSYYLSWIEDLVWPQEYNQRGLVDKVTSNLVEA